MGDRFTDFDNPLGRGNLRERIGRLDELRGGLIDRPTQPRFDRDEIFGGGGRPGFPNFPTTPIPTTPRPTPRPIPEIPIDITIPDPDPWDPPDVIGLPDLIPIPLPVDDFEPLPNFEVQKVVGQSPAAGQVVPTGTPIDLFVSPPDRIPIGVIRDVFEPFRKRDAADIWTTFLDREIEVQGEKISVDTWVQAKQPEEVGDEDIEIMKRVFVESGDDTELPDDTAGWQQVLRGWQAGSMFAGQRFKG